MRKILLCLSCIIFTNFSNSTSCRSEEAEQKSATILRELNDYWTEVSRSVKEGDFKGYSDTCHPSGVLVSGLHPSSLRPPEPAGAAGVQRLGPGACVPEPDIAAGDQCPGPA